MSKTYTNTEVKIAADFITAYLVSKIPVSIRQQLVYDFIITQLIKWTDVIKPTYVKAWGWKTYSYSEKCYIYYVTVVHCSDSSYLNPIHTSVIEVKRVY